MILLVGLCFLQQALNKLTAAQNTLIRHVAVAMAPLGDDLRPTAQRTHGPTSDELRSISCGNTGFDKFKNVPLPMRDKPHLVSCEIMYQAGQLETNANQIFHRNQQCPTLFFSELRLQKLHKPGLDSG